MTTQVHRPRRAMLAAAMAILVGTGVLGVGTASGGATADASPFATSVAGPPGSVAPTSFVQRTMLGSDLFQTDEDSDFWINAVAPSDVDGDGDLDLAVLGFYVVYFQSVEDILVVFHNEGPVDGGWTFTEQRVPLGEVSAGASDLAWGDYDSDGDPDLAVGSNGDTVVFRNDDGTLLAATTTPPQLPGYDEDSGYTGAYDLRSITWADIDNDADLDLLLPSVFDRDTFDYSTRLLRNDGDDGAGGWTFKDMGAALDPTAHAQSAWADDDGDDDVDLFLTNIDPHTETGFVKRFENTGGAFAGQDLLGIKVEYGLADWGDYDADGDLDILVVGNIQEDDGTFDTVLRTYRNDGGLYTPTTLIDAPNADWLDLHAATWADYDSDGDVDLLVTGNFVGDSEIVGKSEIFENDGGTFTPLGEQLPAPIESVGRGGAFTWFDLDNDRDLDYLVAGAYFVPGGNGLVEAQINLFENEAEGTNGRPTAPGDLNAHQSQGGIALDWTAASDDSTPQDALTYEVEVRRAGQAFGPAKRDPAPGTLGAVGSWEVTGLEPGRYAWSVRAVDSAYNAGPRATGTFTVDAATTGLSVTVEPVDPPIVVPATGGRFRFGVRVRNTSDTWQAFELSVIMTMPGGGHRTLGRMTGSVAGGESFRTLRVQDVPGSLGSGRYIHTVSLQRTPTPATSDSFTWFKRA